MKDQKLLKEMEKEIEKTFESLGATFKFTPDADLIKLKKGKQLLIRELKILPENSPVFVVYKEYGQAGYKMNRAMWIFKQDDGSWGLYDGSSFGAEFSPNSERDVDPCIDDCCGEGIMNLFNIK